MGTKYSAGSSSTVTNYQFKDDLKNTSGTAFYYRLKMIDRDSKVSYNRTVLLHKASANAIIVYPNPVVNGSVSLLFTSTTNGIAHLKIIEMSGKVVWQQSNSFNKGDNIIPITKPTRLVPGVYSIQVTTETGIISKKISIVN